MKPQTKDAKVIAMINDLSLESLISLVCMSRHAQQGVRQLIRNEYDCGELNQDDIIAAWEDEQQS